MRLMAFLAVVFCLLGKVRLMALGAGWNLAVGVVACAAKQCSMLALVVAQLDDLAGMAGHARISDIGEFNIERCMWICMAAGTGGKFVVRFAFMALTAERDDLLGCGRMAVMAILTADLSLMFAACRGDINRRLAVALDAVIIL